MKKIYMQPEAQFVAVRNNIISTSSKAVLESEEVKFYNDGVDAGL